jgi:hypothetical protein
MGKIPLPRAIDGDVEQAGRPRRQRRQVPGYFGGELPLPDRQRRCRLRQPVEPQRLEFDLPIEADDADLRKG